MALDSAMTDPQSSVLSCPATAAFKSAQSNSNPLQPPSLSSGSSIHGSQGVMGNRAAARGGAIGQRFICEMSAFPLGIIRFISSLGLTAQHRAPSGPRCCLQAVWLKKEKPRYLYRPQHAGPRSRPEWTVGTRPAQLQQCRLL